ncbi:hypothetical protein ACIRPQ_11915 [Streptomyces sp. NPDC101213]|uniref:hypothetical protein n=1 Tax=Streptomyces sp. NPDC101213 TaxID=3366130 RepID=UPI0038286834
MNENIRRSRAMAADATGVRSLGSTAASADEPPAPARTPPDVSAPAAVASARTVTRTARRFTERLTAPGAPLAYGVTGGAGSAAHGRAGPAGKAGTAGSGAREAAGHALTGVGAAAGHALTGVGAAAGHVLTGARAAADTVVPVQVRDAAGVRRG